MTVESHAGEDVDDFANQSIWSAFFLNVKKRVPSKIPSFSILPRLNYQWRKFLR
jgi:hypothetical protein